MKQTDRILKHLKTRGTITAASAMNLYGIYRLAARVKELKDQGHPIQSKMVSSRNRYGEKVAWKVYWL